MTWQALFGERATTKVAAFFDDEQTAKRLAASLADEAGLNRDQIRMIQPHEQGYDRKIEPEDSAIARTAIRSHLLLGVAGAVVGVVFWAVLYWLGITYIVSSPVTSAAVITAFAIVLGMMLGGLVTARPDHQLVIRGVENAAQEGRWSLVLHPRSPQQCDRVMKLLDDAGANSVRTV